jgi:hypothetical protein
MYALVLSLKIVVTCSYGFSLSHGLLIEDNRKSDTKTTSVTSPSPIFQNKKIIYCLIQKFPFYLEPIYYEKPKRY